MKFRISRSAIKALTFLIVGMTFDKLGNVEITAPTDLQSVGKSRPADCKSVGEMGMQIANPHQLKIGNNL